LNDTDFIVEALGEAESGFVFGLEVSIITIPVPLDPVSNLFVWLRALPAKLGFPVVEDFTGPGFDSVGPEPIEGLPQDVGSIQPLVGLA
jgi:hypothetical protein